MRKIVQTGGHQFVLAIIITGVAINGGHVGLWDQRWTRKGKIIYGKDMRKKNLES